MRPPMSSGDRGDLNWMSLLQVGTVLVVAIGLGYLGGDWLDRKLGTSPWLTVGGVALGSLVGFLDLFRTVSRNLK
jgi:ATP synthase protein I